MVIAEVVEASSTVSRFKVEKGTDDNNDRPPSGAAFCCIAHCFFQHKTSPAYMEAVALGSCTAGQIT